MVNMKKINLNAPEYSLESLHKRLRVARDIKYKWISQYQALYRFVIPCRDAFNQLYGYEDEGIPLENEIYDSTAQQAAFERANDLHDLLMPKDRTWGKISANINEVPPQAVDQMNDWLDQINQRVQYYISASNLAECVPGATLDMVGGMGVLWLDSPSQRIPLRFRSIPSITFFPEYTNGAIQTGWFSKMMSGRDIMREWPKYNGNVKMAIDGSPDDRYCVYYGHVALGSDEDEDSQGYFVYAYLDGDETTSNFLFRDVRDTKSLIAFRDFVRPGETEGRGVGINMLPSIIALNRMAKQDQMSLDMKIDPPKFFDPSAGFNPYSINSLSGLFIASAGGRPAMTVMETPDFPNVEARVSGLQDKINKAFQVDPLGDIGGPTTSATEVQIRENRAQRTSATSISKLINELPRSVYIECAKILFKRNMLKINGSPLSKLNLNSKMVNFEFISPLYKIQQQSDVQNFMQKSQIEQQLFGEGFVAASVDAGAVDSFLTDKFNLPHNLYKTPEQINTLVSQAGQQQAQQPSATPTTAALPVSQINPGVAA